MLAFVVCIKLNIHWAQKKVWKWGHTNIARPRPPMKILKYPMNNLRGFNIFLCNYEKLGKGWGTYDKKWEEKEALLQCN